MVPDLSQIVERAQRPQDPWALMVGIPDGHGGMQQVPVPIGIFIMLDSVVSRLDRIAVALEQRVANEVTR